MGPIDPRGVRGYYHARAGTKEEMARLRENAEALGVTAFKSGIPGTYEWIETSRTIGRAVDSISRLREGLGRSHRRYRDAACRRSHAKLSCAGSMQRCRTWS